MKKLVTVYADAAAFDNCLQTDASKKSVVAARTAAMEAIEQLAADRKQQAPKTLRMLTEEELAECRHTFKKDAYCEQRVQFKFFAANADALKAAGFVLGEEAG